MRAKLSFFLVIVLLLTGNHSLDWMAYGNFTPDNMTIIWNKINSIDPAIAAASLGTFAASFSDYLTDLWHPAWNVAIVRVPNGANNDAVVSGYAYKSHWFWTNGYQINSGYISIIIWKDYNCARWVTYTEGTNSTSSYTVAGVTNSLQNLFVSGTQDDIWTAANSFIVSAINVDDVYRDKYAYTAIVSQEANSEFYMKACVKDYVRVNGMISVGTRYVGTIMMLQMRDK